MPSAFLSDLTERICTYQFLLEPMDGLTLVWTLKEQYRSLQRKKGLRIHGEESTDCRLELAAAPGVERLDQPVLMSRALWEKHASVSHVP